MPKHFLNGYKEASDFSGFTIRQLQRMVKQRLIGVGKEARNRVVFDPAELEAYRKKKWVKALR